MEIEELVNKGSEWFPEGVTAFSKKVDFLYYLIYYSSIFLFIVLLFVFGYFCVRYRKNSKNQVAESQISHNYLRNA